MTSDLQLLWLLRRLRLVPPPPPPLRTRMDPHTVDECVALVRTFAQTPHDDADVLASRMVEAFRHLPPLEETMRHLSMLQQEWEGVGDMHEFCVLQVYGAATCAVAEGLVHHRKPDQKARPSSLRRNSW